MTSSSYRQIKTTGDLLLKFGLLIHAQKEPQVYIIAFQFEKKTYSDMYYKHYVLMLKLGNQLSFPSIPTRCSLLKLTKQTWKNVSS